MLGLEWQSEPAIDMRQHQFRKGDWRVRVIDRTADDHAMFLMAIP